MCQIPHLDTINLRHISEHISSFPKMTKLSVQIQGYIARLFSIEIGKICIIYDFAMVDIKK
jgi:hypothetical protein